MALATHVSSALADGMPVATAKSATEARTLSAHDLRRIFPQRATDQRLLMTAPAHDGPLGLYVVRFDSKATGNGYCGAGSEDYLVLARLAKNAAQPLVSQRIQSCLETQSLYITDGDDFGALVRHLQPDAAHCAVSFERLTEGTEPTRTQLFVDPIRAKLISTAPEENAVDVSCMKVD